MAETSDLGSSSFWVYCETCDCQGPSADGLAAAGEAWDDRHVGEFDYRALLLKYIKHVVSYEGTHFLGPHARRGVANKHLFTDAEWAELRRLAEMDNRSANEGG